MYDFIVIGAGVYGCAAAWHLARAGARVAVLDERGVGTRASGGPGRRGVRANGRDRRELALMPRAYELWPVLHTALGAEPFYERTGHLWLAETGEEVARLEAHARQQHRLGIECELLDAAGARRHEPGLAEGIVAALRCPLDGVADHTAATRAYAAAAARLGVEVRTGTRVAAIELAGGRARGVRCVDGQHIEAEQGVLVLANASVDSLLGASSLPAAGPLPVWNACIQVLLSEPLARVPFSQLTGHVGRTVSLKTHGADRVMISGGWRGRWDPSREEGRATEAAIAGNIAEAAAVYPSLLGMEVALADASHLESFCVDGIPIIDALDAVPGLWIATGWCGHGWAIAPVVAELMAPWVLGGGRPPPLAPFALSRFDRST